MSIHINAEQGEIAEIVLLPGDPLRAKFIAETFLEDVKQYNDVRNMLGFTGTYKGVRVSVQGTGMGVPSISIYATELMKDYGCKKLIRVGTAGALKRDVKVRDVVLAQGATTDSKMNEIQFGGLDFAPIADFDLLLKAYNAGKEAGLNLRVGNVYTADLFYGEKNPNEMLADYGVLAVEMEAAALYTLAAKYDAQALAILTISDHLITGEVTTSEERQLTFKDMMVVALEAAIQE
ncbi:purine nucleoside phosphorylase DeoD-type [Kurthia zopfii]|uniref:Purine nucleoside phosphorylase DeoD-type n=1 Tax=Kurthia zopfii TaxID=1650 RepID=A0A2U3A991_9BACL|nr:purine-nucleoside phosphorylase [Kurthia zopfii]PWI21075.1 purine-nucleoside phosphorylase [Kurthia zopfii]TDR32058.1 purine-nucleoside phosphorylase [Kurthia zopfii]STX09484.1 Purine nucleoside phosphorylase deoD-type [Kurthia zopfii]VEI06549.1 Purine nucleoside phosphorylase deoD-type [Kurthia zopfii]GEK32395.1 purine nucleoside phosphorylase DeoD-type [Kurthia zopfii]